MKSNGKPDLSFLNAGNYDLGGSAKVSSTRGYNRTAKGLLGTAATSEPEPATGRGLLGRLFRR